MSAPEEFCLSRAIQMFALLLLFYYYYYYYDLKINYRNYRFFVLWRKSTHLGGYTKNGFDALIRRSTVGSRTFTASGAAVWNDLPAHVTAAPLLAAFRQRLKTFLFSRSYPDIVT